MSVSVMEAIKEVKLAEEQAVKEIEEAKNRAEQIKVEAIEEAKKLITDTEEEAKKLVEEMINKKFEEFLNLLLLRLCRNMKIFTHP